MDTRNNNRLNMIGVTIGYCEQHAAATAGIPNFALRLTDVKDKKVLIDTLNQIVNSDTKGITTDVLVLRDMMTKKALKCANATLAYANAAGNNELKGQVNYTRYKLDRLPKEDVDDVCQTVHDVTDANFAAVSPYGLVASDVTDAQVAIDLYRAAMGNSRLATLARSQANRQAKLMVKELINELLVGQLDKMVRTLEESNSDFVDGYKQARITIDLGSTTTKVTGTVLNELDVPLKGVWFRLFETGTTHVVREVQTDVRGKFSAAELTPGDYDLQWEYAGYKTVNEADVHIGPGKELKRKIVMEEGSNGVVVREVHVVMGMVGNIETPDVPELNPMMVVRMEALNSNGRFYASETGTGLPGAVYLDVSVGGMVQKTAQEMKDELGFDEVKPFFNVQNTGAVDGDYRITFSNI